MKTKYLFTRAAIFFLFLNNSTSFKFFKRDKDSGMKRHELYYPDRNGKPEEINMKPNNQTSKLLKDFYKNELEMENENTPFNAMKSLISAKIEDIAKGALGMGGMLGFSRVESPEIFNFSRSDVTFTLYTRGYPRGINLSENYDFEEFDVKKPTKILFHGYRQNGTSDTGVTIKDNYLSVSDINVIIVDYSSVAGKIYLVAVFSLGTVADYCAKFIAYLFNEVGLGPKTTHFIGHSLGAHLAGFTGKRLIVKWGRKVQRISGLDPAGPLFRPTHLTKNDAKFVDIIHTDRNGLGIDLSIGHVDFYPNGGKNPQPNCTNETVFTSNSCSHKQSWLMYSQTILNGDLYIANCTDGNRYPMGSKTPANARGNCILRTD